MTTFIVLLAAGALITYFIKSGAFPTVEPKTGIAASDPKPDVVSAQQPIPSPRKAMDGLTFEQILGAYWSVLVGGVALALGGVFLVKYSIDAGLFGPKVRLLMGAALALALLAFGEWLRRSDLAAKRQIFGVSIPAVLTSAGASTAFGVAYAAHAVYGFITPAPAAIVLGAIAVATTCAALVHGPILGAVGILGAFGAPILIETAPNAWALHLYLLAPTAAAFAVGVKKDWPAMIIAAGVAAAGWGALSFSMPFHNPVSLAVYASALILFAVLLHTKGRPEAPPVGDRPDLFACGLIATYAVLAVLAITSPISVDRPTPTDGADFLAVAEFIPFSPSGLHFAFAVIIVAALLGLSGLLGGLAPLAPAAAGLATLAILNIAWHRTNSPIGPVELGVMSAALASVTLLANAWFSYDVGRTPSWRPISHALAAAGGALAILVAADIRIIGFQPDFVFSGLALAIGAALAVMTDISNRLEGSGRQHPAVSAIYAAGVVSSIGLAIGMGVRGAGLTMCLPFVSAALGVVAMKRPHPALGYAAMAVAAIAVIRIGLNPGIVDGYLSETPIFNELLWGYGLPAAAFWLAAFTFRHAKLDLPSVTMAVLALLHGFLLVFVEIRHFTNGGVISNLSFSLGEIGLHAIALFSLSAFLGWYGKKTEVEIVSLASCGLALAGIGTAVLLLVLRNPYLSHMAVPGGSIVNVLLLAYLLPGAAAFAASRFGDDRGDKRFGIVLECVGFVLALAWATLAVRRYFHDSVHFSAGFEQLETWAYSAVWLAAALGLLGLAVQRSYRPLRIVAVSLTSVVVLKVFLFDLGDLEGLPRALSFIVLGMALIGMGLVYQRVILPRDAKLVGASA